MEHNSSEELFRNHTINRRQFIITGTQLCALSIMLTRMYYLQIAKHDNYNTLSDKNYIHTTPIIPKRGAIFDKNRVLLVHTKKTFRLVLHNAKIISDTLSKLNALGIECPHQSKVGKEITLIDKLEWKDLIRVEENISDLPEVQVDACYTREYNYNQSISHIIGYLGLMNRQDQIAQQMNIPNFYIGKSGIERFYNESLIGSFGSRSLEVDAYGRIVREIKQTNSTNGKDLHINIDIRLQENIYRNFDNKKGGAIVYELATGKILSMVSVPGFDMNCFIDKNQSEQLKSTLLDSSRLLFNRMLQAQYSPGSIFKLVSCAAFLKSGIDPTRPVICNGKPYLGDHFHCWNKSGHGSTNMIKALAQSCNAYMFYNARLIGYEAMMNTIKDFGFFQHTGIDLPFESTKDFSKNITRPKLADLLNMSIGQGVVSMNMLQMLRVTSVIATNGKFMRPHILDIQNNDMSSTQSTHNILDDEEFGVIQQGMIECVNGIGTGRACKINELDIAGKTGTAQVKSKTSALQDLSATTVPLEHRNHGFFVSYAPSHNPLYAVVVFVEHGGGGASSALPIARQIYLHMMDLGYYS